MTTKLQRNATALSALMLMGLATVPGAHAFMNPKVTPCDVTPPIIDYNVPQPAVLDTLNNDDGSSSQTSTCNDRGIDCLAFATSSGQNVAQDLGTGTSRFTQEQALEAVGQVTAGLTDLCVDVDGNVPIGPSCVAHSERGVASVVCIFGCPWKPKPTSYRAMTQAIDSSPTVPQPAVYGAVSCWAGQFVPVPPFGVSCADSGYCSNTAEGLKWMTGHCIHLAAGDNPQIVDRDCEY